eukprot:93880-Chlamydomonas_euryale.AAC.1
MLPMTTTWKRGVLPGLGLGFKGFYRLGFKVNVPRRCLRRSIASRARAEEATHACTGWVSR